MRLAYGKDHITILSELRQLPDELVRIYSIRLKTNLKLLGIKSDANQSTLIRLDYFLKGPFVSKVCFLAN